MTIDPLRHNPQVVEKLSHLTRNIPVTILAVYPDQTCDVELASNFIAQWERQEGVGKFFAWVRKGRRMREDDCFQQYCRGICIIFFLEYHIVFYIFLYVHVCSYLPYSHKRMTRSNPKKY